MNVWLSSHMWGAPALRSTAVAHKAPPHLPGPTTTTTTTWSTSLKPHHVWMIHAQTTPEAQGWAAATTHWHSGSPSRGMPRQHVLLQRITPCMHHHCIDTAGFHGSFRTEALAEVGGVKDLLQQASQRGALEWSELAERTRLVCRSGLALGCHFTPRGARTGTEACPC